MSLNERFKSVTVIMSLISLSVFLIVLVISTAKSDWQQQKSSVKSFKDYVTNMIKEQSTKIQSMLRKIQNNAQSVLDKIENIKQDSKTHKRNLVDIFKKKSENEIAQLESPILKTGLDTTDSTDSRSYNYQTTSYGASGNANYGVPTYHHHSIGFDPINIVVSVSLLSFLLQALQGLLSRTRFPTPVVEAKSLNSIEDWTKSFQEKLGKDKFYLKKKYLKKYY